MADDVLTKLKKRDDERLQLKEQRRADAAEANVEEETTHHFSRSFLKARNDILKLLDQCDSLEKNVLNEQFDNITEKLRLLTKYLNDSARFLPSYEIKTAQIRINDLSSILKAKRELLVPKKKFAFKARAKQTDKKTPVDNVTIPSRNEEQEDISFKILSLEKRPGFHKQANCTLKADSKLLEGSDFCLSNLTNCTVIIEDVSPEIHIESLINCKVICKPVSRSVFMENCQDCLFIVACQQLRVHGSSKCQFYLHVTSNGIIEDSNHISVSPLTWEYDGLNEDMVKAGLNPHVNNWDGINDFNWLKKDEQSPNWGITCKTERLSHSDIVSMIS